MEKDLHKSLITTNSTSYCVFLLHFQVIYNHKQHTLEFYVLQSKITLLCRIAQVDHQVDHKIKELAYYFHDFEIVSNNLGVQRKVE